MPLPPNEVLLIGWCSTHPTHQRVAVVHREQSNRNQQLPARRSACYWFRIQRIKVSCELLFTRQSSLLVLPCVCNCLKFWPSRDRHSTFPSPNSDHPPPPPSSSPLPPGVPLRRPLYKLFFFSFIALPVELLWSAAVFRSLLWNSDSQAMEADVTVSQAVGSRTGISISSHFATHRTYVCIWDCPSNYPQEVGPIHCMMMYMYSSDDNTWGQKTCAQPAPPVISGRWRRRRRTSFSLECR